MSSTVFVEHMIVLYLHIFKALRCLGYIGHDVNVGNIVFLKFLFCLAIFAGEYILVFSFI